MVEKRILHGTIFSEDYWFCMPYFMRYTLAEHELYKNMETLIVVNNISKKTVETLAELTEMYPFIKVKNVGLIPNPRPGMLNIHAVITSRNAMFQMAKDEKFDGLLSVDFDTIPNPGSLEKLVPYLDLPNIALVGGNYHFKGAKSVVGGPVVVGKFPVEDDELKEIEKAEWTDKVLGLGFGFTLFNGFVFNNTRYHCFTEYLKDAPRGTEDFPVCKRVLTDGYRMIWVKNIRAKHLLYNKEKNRVEAW